jgi:hypothetical protein
MLLLIDGDDPALGVDDDEPGAGGPLIDGADE